MCVEMSAEQLGVVQTLRNPSKGGGGQQGVTVPSFLY